MYDKLGFVGFISFYGGVTWWRLEWHVNLSPTGLTLLPFIVGERGMVSEIRDCGGGLGEDVYGANHVHVGRTGGAYGPYRSHVCPASKLRYSTVKHICSVEEFGDECSSWTHTVVLNQIRESCSTSPPWECSVLVPHIMHKRLVPGHRTLQSRGYCRYLDVHFWACGEVVWSYCVACARISRQAPCVVCHFPCAPVAHSWDHMEQQGGMDKGISMLQTRSTKDVITRMPWATMRMKMMVTKPLNEGICDLMH